MIYKALGTYRRALITIAQDEARRALRIPFAIALLALVTFKSLSSSSPELERLLTAKF